MNRRERSQHAALIALLADAQATAKFWRKSAERSAAAHKAAEVELIEAWKTVAQKADEIQALTFENDNLLTALTYGMLPDLLGPIAVTDRFGEAPIYDGLLAERWAESVLDGAS